MCFSYGLARKFAILTFFELTLKILYLIGLIIYLIYYVTSGAVNNFVFNRLNDVIVHMGARTLFIAALVAFALECICLYGLWTGKCWPNVAYLLMHISVVPLYFYYNTIISNFVYLWLFYVSSLITSILLMYILIVMKCYNDDLNVSYDVEANRVPRSDRSETSQHSSSTDSEAEAESEVVATSIREKGLLKPKNPQSGGAQNQARGKQSEAKPAVTGVQQKNLSKPKPKPAARTVAAQSQTRSQPKDAVKSRGKPNPNLEQRNDQKTKQKVTYQESSFVLPKPTTPNEEPTDATEEYDQEDYIEEEDGEEENHIPASVLPKQTPALSVPTSEKPTSTSEEPASNNQEPAYTPHEPTRLGHIWPPKDYNDEDYDEYSHTGSSNECSFDEDFSDEEFFDENYQPNQSRGYRGRGYRGGGNQRRMYRGRNSYRR